MYSMWEGEGEVIKVKFSQVLYCTHKLGIGIYYKNLMTYREKYMCFIDDPKLALIARFVVDDIDNISISDEMFLQHQITEIRAHVEKSPKKQQQQLALEWINEHAEQYRRGWRKRSFSRAVLDKRCVDCPLVHDNSGTFCTIHGKWVVLLKKYAADKIDSNIYIEETLKLLEKNKANLKVSTINLNFHHD